MELDNCPDCGVSAGSIHLESCDIEHCSNCGLQRISCNCPTKLHDKSFAYWSGLYPGEAECFALGFITPEQMPDFNKLYSTGLYKKFFCKPR